MNPAFTLAIIRSLIELPDLLSTEIFLCPEYFLPPDLYWVNKMAGPEFFQAKKELMLNRLERYSHCLIGLDPVDPRNLTHLLLEGA